MTIAPSSATMEEDEKPRTLLIGNLPRETHKREIENVFGEIGPLKRCYIQYPRDDKKKRSSDPTTNSSLLCYVTFALAEDAVKALETLSNHKFGSSKINLKFAKTRSEQVRPKLTQEEIEANRKARPAQREALENEDGDKRFKNPNMIPVGGVAPEIKKPKGPRIKTENKKSRLIIRNLSFKVTEEKIKEYFGACGVVKDINILKKPDGRLVGCAFVQFETVPQAAKAVRELNHKPFLGRPIAIDWALAKKDFQGGDDKEEIKEEVKVEDGDEVTIKDEPEDVPSDGDEDEVKFINPYESMDIDDIKSEDEKEKKPERKKRKIKEIESDEDEDNADDEEKSTKRPKRTNDVEEGKTLFLRNLDFGVTEEEMKTFFEGYGPIHYSLLCKDRLTEHPKGTGFVKFIDVDDATKCLTDFNINSNNFKLGNRLFAVSVAIAREKLTSGADDKTEKIKHDNRNLYLVREGFIRPGSGAAEDVSLTDMNKRASLNSTKKQMLKNLSIFVSPIRLCVHNLPPKLTDKALRKLFKKYSAPEARITEARIMRDMKDIQLGGKGKSKEFGFVTFKEPEHALAALRAMNNNPEVFNNNQRPIVEFSLENKKALQAKEKRQQKSVENNKLAQSNEAAAAAGNSKKSKKNKKPKTETADGDDQKPPVTPPVAPKTPSKKAIKKTEKKEAKDNSYVGLTGKRGVSKLPVNKAKGNTGKISRKNLRGKKAQQIKFQERRMREPQIKPKRSIDQADKSEKMVTKYKQKMEKAHSSNSSKKSKWYSKE